MALFPQGLRCMVCSRELSTSNELSLCEDCILLLNTVFCPSCGRAYKPPKASWRYVNPGLDERVEYEERVCEKCKRYPMYFKAARSAIIFTGNGRRLVFGFKFGNKRYLANELAKLMVREYRRSGWQVDMVVFSPSSKKRLRWRGYNQAQLLAEEFCEQTGLSLVDVLVRSNSKMNSALMSKRKRAEALSKLISVQDGIGFNGQRILFIDDVLTTGATSNECAKQLLLRGAGEVYVLTLASGYLIMDVRKKRK